MNSTVRSWTDGEKSGEYLYLWCPACDDLHGVEVSGEGAWAWDGNRDAPTISPSILVTSNDPTKPRCHSFVCAGRWEFLGDSTHALTGQTVNVVPVPDWLATETKRKSVAPSERCACG
jgi:hypothetical protein